MLYVLDKDFIKIAVIDDFISCVWTERYSEAGDFELCISMNADSLLVFKRDYYIQKSDSNVLMIIETMKIEYNVDAGYLLTISGRSLESILDRRIVWNTVTISGNLQAQLLSLVANQFDGKKTSPTIYQRTYDKFVTKDSSDPQITDLTISDMQFTGDNVYDIVTAICYNYGLGFRIALNSDKKMEFSLYVGENHEGTEDVNVIEPSTKTLTYKNRWSWQGTKSDMDISLIRCAMAPEAFWLAWQDDPWEETGFLTSYPVATVRVNYDGFDQASQSYARFSFEFVAPENGVGLIFGVGQPGKNDAPFPGAAASYQKLLMWDANNSKWDTTEYVHFIKGTRYTVNCRVRSTNVDVASRTDGFLLDVLSITTPLASVGTSPVIFSEEYNNLISSSYVESSREFKNVALVAGEDSGSNRKTREVYYDDSLASAGLERRELYVDARDIQSEYYDTNTGQQIILTDAEYANALSERGKQKLADLSQESSFEAEVDTSALWKIKTDYDLGDIVQIDTSYGVRNPARVTEIVYSEESGERGVYPGFELL